MPRPLRFFDDRYLFLAQGDERPIALFEITTPVVQGVSFFRGGRRARAHFIGALGRAQSRYDFKLFGFRASRGGWRMLAGFYDPATKARAMKFINERIAWEMNRLLGRQGAFFGSRNQCVQITSLADALRRLAGMTIPAPPDASGAADVLPPSAAPWLLYGQPIGGVWLRRAAMTRARARGETVRPDDFTEHTALALSPLPGLDQGGAQAYHQLMRRAVARAEGHAKARKSRQARQRARHQAPARRGTRRCPRRATGRAPIHGPPDDHQAWWSRYRKVRSAYTLASTRLRKWHTDSTISLLPWPDGTLPPMFGHPRGQDP